MPQDQSPVLPSNFTVAFIARRCAGHPADYYRSFYLSHVSLSDAGFPGLTGAPGSLGLRTTALALYSTPNGPPTNQAALDAMAVQMATDFAAWRSVVFDVAYNGIVAPEPSGLNDLVEWTYTATECATRVTSVPLDGEPRGYQHQDPAVTGCVDDPGGTYVVDKTPAIEIDIPDGRGGSMHGLLTIENGRPVIRPGSSDKAAGCGCAGTPITTSILFNVFGCNGYAARTVLVFVLASDGHTYTGTTNTSGQVTITGIPVGSATITYTSPLARFAVLTQTTAVTTSTTMINATLQPTAGYHCCSYLWAIPIAETLFFTDSKGTHKFDFASPSGGNSCYWSLCYFINMPGVWQSDAAGDPCFQAASNIGVSFELSPTPSGGNIAIHMNYFYTCASPNGSDPTTLLLKPPVSPMITGCPGGPITYNCTAFVSNQEGPQTNTIVVDPYTPPPFTLTWQSSVPDGCPMPVTGNVTVSE